MLSFLTFLPLIFGLDDAAAAAIIGAGISAVGGLASSYATRRGNKKLADQEFKNNMDAWRLQSEYNSPSAQISRLKAANLNPALAYGGSGQVVGNADPTPNLDYSGAMNTPVFDSSSAIAQGLSIGDLKKQMEVSDSTIEMNKASALKLHMDAIRSSTMLDVDKRLAEQNIMTSQAQESKLYIEADSIQEGIAEIRSRVALNETQKQGLDIANEIAFRTKEEQINYTKIRNRKEEAEIREINKKMSLYDAEIDELGSRIALNMSNARYTDEKRNETQINEDVLKQTFENLGKESSLIDEKIREYAAQADISEKDAKWYVFNKISSTVLDAAEVGIKAYTGAGFVNAALSNARTGDYNAKTQRSVARMQTGHDPYGPYYNKRK